MPKKKDVPGRVSFLYGVLFVLLLCGLLAAVYFIEVRLPAALTSEDEVEGAPRFVAQRAKAYLRGLTDIGPRVVGSVQNEVLAVEYLRGAVADIVAAGHASQRIESDLQLVGGSYYLAYKPYGSINAYANLQNLVVKVHSRNGSPSDRSVLINAHYDTMTTSPGGSDDGISCAVMLEVLRQLSRMPDRPRHDVVFLFNGGEESNIQASHGFVTRHRWARGAGVVVNLEATGAGGKEILFQSGPERAWLMEYYSAVPYPFAHVAGEEIFKSNIVPSDSDFRIFRDFGGLVGYDFAYIKDGYRYHTEHDGFANIEDGRYQRTGANVLSLVLGLSGAPEVSGETAPGDDGGAVFFDVFGLFVARYGRTAELTLNVAAVALSLATALWGLIGFRTVGRSAKGCFLPVLKLIEILTEWAVSAVLALAVALLLGGIGRTMGWYRTPLLAVGLYSTATLSGCCGVLLVANRFLRKDSSTIQEDVIVHSHLTRVIWTAVVLVGTCCGVRSVYLLVIPVAFNTVTAWVIHGFRMHETTNWWVFVYVAGNVFPTMFTFGISFHVLWLFIPICGRFGAELNPEIIVGLITVLLTITSLCYYIPLILLIRSPAHVLLCLLSCFVASFVLILTPVGFPYSGDPGDLAPQRFSIYHTRRVFHDADGDVARADSGFHFLPMDYNSPDSVRPYVPELETALSVEKDCREFLFCGLPVAYSRDFEELHKTVWIPAEAPVFNRPLPHLAHSRTALNGTAVRYSFTISGPDCMDVYLSPKPGVSFLRTDLNEFIPDEQPLWNGRPTLYILYVYGRSAAPLDFYVDFEVPRGWDGPVLDVAVTGKYVHELENNGTAGFRRFLSGFPDFAAINARIIAHYESWMI